MTYQSHNPIHLRFFINPFAITNIIFHETFNQFLKKSFFNQYIRFFQ